MKVVIAWCDSFDVGRRERGDIDGGKGASIGYQADLLGDSIGSFDVTYDTSAAGVIDVTPYDGKQKYSIKGNSTGGADTINYCIASNNCKSYDVHVDLSTTYEPDAFTSSGKLGGVLQTFMDQAYWGVEYFNPEPSCKETTDKKSGQKTMTCTGPQGGIIAIPLADHSTNANFISSVNNINPETYTPPAEALYVAAKYFEQLDPGADYKNTVPINPTCDPFQRHGQDDLLRPQLRAACGSNT